MSGASPLAEIEAWVAGLSVPAYAIDDQTAIKVVDGTVEVVSEGQWKVFTVREGPLRPCVDQRPKMTP